MLYAIFRLSGMIGSFEINNIIRVIPARFKAIGEKLLI
jgi:hypothetical protein